MKVLFYHNFWKVSLGVEAVSDIRKNVKGKSPRVKINLVQLIAQPINALARLDANGPKQPL